MTENQKEIARKIIYSVETGGQVYGQVRYNCYVGKNTNSAKETACTIGGAGNHAGTAKKLMQMILTAFPDTFRANDTAGIESDLKRSWDNYDPGVSSKKAKCIQKIISTSEGIKCQDTLLDQQISARIKKAESMGVPDLDAQIMCANIVHLGGQKALDRVLEKTKKPYMLNNIFSALKTDQLDLSSNNQVGDKKYWLRHEKVYRWLKSKISNQEVQCMISNCGHDENGRYAGGRAGDQTGGEWAIIPWYNRPWNYVLRHPDPKVREEIAMLAERAAKNNLIGYDQNQRTTYWQHLKASNYDPAQITIACEADCSSGVAANVKAAGYRLDIPALKNVSKDCYTGNLRAALKAAGFEVLTASKYLASPDYLLRGDILLYEGHHTATNLTNGNKSGATSGSQSATDSAPFKPADNTSYIGNVAKGQKWLNSNYGTLIKNECGALLSVDDDYGAKSRSAALCVWKDVVNRKYGFFLTPSNSNFGFSCKVAANEAQIKKGANGTLAYIVEFILSAKGYYTGAMDADFGTDLKTAVKAFQKERGLTPDGVVGPDTWLALFN